MVTLAAWLAIAVVTVFTADAEQPTGAPTARLIPARPMTLPGAADSNTPAVWETVDGLRRLFLLTSVAGTATRHVGADLVRAAPVGGVTFTNHPGHGLWMEAIIPDIDGTWYGFYHHETPAMVCDDRDRMIPRIGAARSRDLGATWEDLGIVLEAPAGTEDCTSTNEYFVGGVGDFTAILDENGTFLYFFFSQYVRPERLQGVSVARIAWADRDAPVGKITVWWRNHSWVPARAMAWEETVRQTYPVGTPIYAAAESWHDADAIVDAFWGPAVHWNTHLGQYVMLLNRASDATWSQEGVYVAFAPRLDDPTRWTRPQRVLTGGRWYPQVIGLEDGASDKQAGEFARFFMGGRSDHVIQFSR